VISHVNIAHDDGLWMVVERSRLGHALDLNFSKTIRLLWQMTETKAVSSLTSGYTLFANEEYQRKPQMYQIYSRCHMASANQTSMPTPNAFSTKSASPYGYSRSGCVGCRY
jgi:hypothetical protein